MHFFDLSLSNRQLIVSQPKLVLELVGHFSQRRILVKKSSVIPKSNFKLGLELSDDVMSLHKNSLTSNLGG